MGKFNKVAKELKATNLVGGVAYARGFKEEVASVILSSMLNGKGFYETEAERIINIERLIKENPSKYGEFLAKAMVYVRTVGNLRSISHLMAVLLAENVKGSTYLRKALTKAMITPNDMIEMLALWKMENDEVMPNAMRRAMKDALETKWTEYHLKKYANSKGVVKLADVVKLARPDPSVKVNTSDVNLFTKVIEDTLPKIATASTVNAGSTGEDRAINYSMMLSEGSLGYMAALKNLKNILECGLLPADIANLCALLSNSIAVKRSMVLPFRFVDALEALNKLGVDEFVKIKVRKALEAGFIASSANVGIVKDGEKIALLLDESGSMNGQPFKVGLSLMACVLSGLEVGDAIGYLWADNTTPVDVSSGPFNFITNTHTRGGGTDVASPLRKLIEYRTYVDKVIIFTDMELYDTDGRYWGINRREVLPYINEYKKLVNPNVRVVFWNLSGNSDGSPVRMREGIMEVSGFSDKLLGVVATMLDTGDSSALINEIEQIKL